MPKIRITCNDPCATDSSSDDDESIAKEKPQTGGVFLEEISVSVPLFIPTTISTVHIDSLARLKSDSSFRVDESESSEDGPNCIVLALSARKPEDTPGRKSGILSICKSLEKSSMAQKGEVDATNISSEEDGPIEASPTSVNVAGKSRIQGASGHPGVYKKCGKWVVRVRDPIRKRQMWVGTYNTLEEAINIHNKKKLEYAPLGSEMFMEDASFRVDESNSYLAKEPEDNGSKDSVYPGNLPVQNMVMQDASSRLDESESSVGERRCIVLGLSARQPEDTRRKKSAVINGFEKLSIAVDIPTAKNPSNGTEKHPGLRLQSTGKWGVQIQDPVKKSRIWLGTYRTIEEAKDVYAKKKLEFASMTPAVFKHKKTPLPKAKSKQKNFRLGSHDTPDEAVKSYNRKPEFDSSYNCHGVGKSSSIVRDPRDKPEEAVKSYSRVMLEFDSSYNCDSVVNSSSILNEEALKLAETEKWRVAIRHPMLKHSFSLGLYETPEEAAEVYNKKQLELDALLQSDDKTTTKQPIQDLPVNKYKGVRPSGTGRWMARIQGPFISKKRISLGTYNTPEEAAEAFNRTRREFDAIVSLFSKRKREGASEAHEKKMKKKQKVEFPSKKAIILDEALIANDQRTSHFEIVVLPHSYSHQQHRVDDVYAPIQTETSNNSDETDTCVVDIFGQLVGEYSSLDDELWLSRPGDDEFDANVVVGGDSGELDWDHNLKPSFL